MEARLRNRMLILHQKVCAARSTSLLGGHTVRPISVQGPGLMTCISTLFKGMLVFITLSCEHMQGINRWADGA